MGTFTTFPTDIEPRAGELSVPQLEAALTSLAGHINAATCRFLLLLGEFDAREGWAVGGVLSCSHWLTWRCGLSSGAAREHVRVARSLRDLPKIRESFAAGRLSFSKVRALTRVATASREPELVELALSMPSGPLERFLRGLERSLDADPDAVADAVAVADPVVADADPVVDSDALETVERRAAAADVEGRRHSRRCVRWHWDDDGSLVLSARLSPEDGALVVEALEATRAELERAAAEAHRPDELPDPELGPYQDLQDVPAGKSSRRSLADALVQICAEAGHPDSDDPDTIPNPTRRPELIVHVDLAHLMNAEGRPDNLGPRIESGPALQRETARRLACDARIVISVDGPTGQTLDLGRASRFPNAALTRMLWHRDGGCRFPGCDRRRYLHAHHLVHWADGGHTTAANLALLCGPHHRATHEGRYQVSREADGELVFTSPAGEVITPAPAVSGRVDGLVVAHDAVVGEWTATPTWFGDRLDLSLAVLATRSAWLHREFRPEGVPAGTPSEPVPAGTPGTRTKPTYEQSAYVPWTWTS